MRRRERGWIAGSRTLVALLAVGLGPLAGGCAHHVVNAPLTAPPDPDTGYRFDNLASGGDDELFLILTFSGGGTRAASLAYGVLAELSRIELPAEGGRRRTLLDEVDVISSVSGGSFTAAYYALFGEERLFTCYEDEFLRKNVQGALKRLLLYPSNWVRLASPSYDRIDMAADFYDRTIFRRKTFDALVAQDGRPFVVMNATDMGEGNRFEFTQDRFDYLCSDLSSYPVARGVAASSAFPGLLTSITLHNHACAGMEGKERERCGMELPCTGPEPPPGCVEIPNACGFQVPDRVTVALADREVNPRRYVSAIERTGYIDPERPYLHLLDGGVADNIGLRGPYEALTSEVSAWSRLPAIRDGEIGRIVVIVVNAKKQGQNEIDRRHNAPNLLRTLQTAASTPMSHYSFDTVQLLREFFQERSRSNREYRYLRENCPECANLRRPAAEVEYLHVDVAFDRLTDEDLKQDLYALPTSFALPDEAVNQLIGVAPTVLGEDPGFQDLLDALGAERQDRDPFGECRP